MPVISQQPVARRSLLLTDMCNEVTMNFHVPIKQGCLNAIQFLKLNEDIKELLPSESALLHLLFYQLNYEIRLCISKETRELFPLVSGESEKDVLELERTLQSYKTSHSLVLQLVEKIRRILHNYELKASYSRGLQHFIAELNKLEDNIFSWIYIEEDLLFPKVIGDAERGKYITTVFR